MYLGIAGSVRKAPFIHAAVLGIIFVCEFLTVNLAFGEIEPGRVLDILDSFKARYPAIPIEISPESFLFSLFAVSSGGESHWVGMARQNIFSLSRIIMILAAAAVPCLIFLCRFIRSGLGIRKYVRCHWLVLSCSASAFAPVIMSVFSIDFFRWLAWSFILSSYFAMQMSDAAEEQPSEKSKSSGAVSCLLSASALFCVVFYMPAGSSDGTEGGSGILEKSNLWPLVTVFMMQTGHPEFGREYLYWIANEKWNWQFDTRAAGVSVEDRVSIRYFGRQGTGSNDPEPEPLESGCGGEFLSMYVSGGRLYLSGWEAMLKRSDNGRISLVKPAHGMGFLVNRGESRVFYPTMPLIMDLKMEGRDKKIPLAFDDYLLIGNGHSGSKITIYPAFLNGKNQVFYCTGSGKTVVLPSQTVPAGSHS